MKFELSDKDRKTLFIFLSLLVIACSFFFIYWPNMRTVDTINEETESLEDELVMYQQQAVKVEELKKEIKVFEEDSQKLVEQFPVAVTEEKAIRFIRDLEETCHSDVNTVSFTPIAQFYPSLTQATDQTTNTTDTGAQSDLFGYELAFKCEFTTTYEELKNIIDFINNNEESISIKKLKAGYDSATGELFGQIDLEMYCVPTYGTPYITPIFDGISIGVENIFGTINVKEQTVSPK